MSPLHHVYHLKFMPWTFCPFLVSSWTQSCWPHLQWAHSITWIYLLKAWTHSTNVSSKPLEGATNVLQLKLFPSHHTVWKCPECCYSVEKLQTLGLGGVPCWWVCMEAQLPTTFKIKYFPVRYNHSPTNFLIVDCPALTTS